MITTPQNAAPYPVVNDILNTARVRMNDVIKSQNPTTGVLLENTDAFSQQVVNTAYQKMQQDLQNLGYSRLERTEIVTALPTVGSLDPASRMWIDWNGCFDGSGLFTTPYLPPNLWSPLKVWERQTGQNACFTPMGYAFDGIPDRSKNGYNGVYEWEDDKIYLPGSTYSMDLKVRFIAFLLPFADDPATQLRWYEQKAEIAGCQDALANYCCIELATSRTDVSAALFQSAAEAGMRLIMNRDTKLKERYDNRRRSYSGRLEGYGGSIGNVW